MPSRRHAPQSGPTRVGLRARGELEQEVLSCLASVGEPMTPAQVQAQLGDVAYTTVMTILSRLHAKRALERHKTGRAYSYFLLGDAKSAHVGMAAERMRKALDAAPDRRAALERFVAGLTAAEARLLGRLLELRAANNLVAGRTRKRP